MTIRIIGIGLIMLIAYPVLGQPVDRAQAFEVASAKVSDARGRANVEVSPGGLTIDGDLNYILQWAYEVKSRQLSGPGWLGTDRFHVTGKSPGPVSVRDLRKMLQTLLADRFKLAVHRE